MDALVDFAAMADPGPSRKILRERFGFADFLPGQAEAIGALLDGEDVFALWPTGGGKSLLYQFAALARPGLTVVVSPLIALMRDQTEKLAAGGVAAAAWHAGMAAEDYFKMRSRLERSALKLLYLSPERLADPATLALLRDAGANLLAVDEAHCVSHWGHDFRPEYRQIGAAAEVLGFPQIVAVTATAGAQARADIVANLFSRPPRLFIRSFRRPAIALSALARRRDATRQILELAGARRGSSGILYCGSRQKADFLARALTEAGHRAAAYHAGLPARLRDERQDEFLARSDMVMAATIAFGLGVDKPDVRYVIHCDLPDHLETLYQETGRAGRDGKPAEAIALYAPAEIPRLRAARFEIAEVDEAAARRAKIIADYFSAEDCRERVLLAALGEKCMPCGRCDNCRKRFPALRKMARLVRRAPGEARVFAWRVAAAGFAKRAPPPSSEPPPEAEAAADPVEGAGRRMPALTVEEARRLRRLRAARQAVARRAGVAPSRLIGDAALARLALAPPRDLADLIARCGDETGLLERFGAALAEAARPDAL